MAVIAVVSDLIFSTKITGTGKQLGQPVSVARSIARLTELLDGAGSEPLVIVDLNVSGVDAIEAVRVAKGHGSGAKVVAFLSHVEVELAQQARAAGADQVMARSGFVTALPGLLAPKA